ncbi:MAG: hypothetical protein BWX45_00945 [Deltaproteobacteria bacterium ADurb.Bin002]|nr:MAG: hypothetical protein BWX45_00945 [Deltaproteobacteria bacterium ADurb.Bin002]
MQKAVGARLGRTQVVSVKKAAGQIEEVVIRKALFAEKQLTDVDDIVSVGARQFAGMRHFHFTVGAVAGKDDRFDLVCHR